MPVLCLIVLDGLLLAQVWAQHRVSVGEKISCPLCRADWGPLALSFLSASMHQAKEGAQQRERREGKRLRGLKIACSRCDVLVLASHTRFSCVHCKVPHTKHTHARAHLPSAHPASRALHSAQQPVSSARSKAGVLILTGDSLVAFAGGGFGCRTIACARCASGG